MRHCSYTGASSSKLVMEAPVVPLIIGQLIMEILVVPLLIMEAPTKFTWPKFTW